MYKCNLQIPNALTCCINLLMSSRSTLLLYPPSPPPPPPFLFPLHCLQADVYRVFRDSTAAYVPWNWYNVSDGEFTTIWMQTTLALRRSQNSGWNRQLQTTVTSTGQLEEEERLHWSVISQVSVLARVGKYACTIYLPAVTLTTSHRPEAVLAKQPNHTSRDAPVPVFQAPAQWHRQKQIPEVTVLVFRLLALSHGMNPVREMLDVPVQCPGFWNKQKRRGRVLPQKLLSGLLQPRTQLDPPAPESVHYQRPFQRLSNQLMMNPNWRL